VGVKAHGMEVLFEYTGTSAGGNDGTAALLSKATQTGNRYRLHVSEEDLYATLEELHRVGAKIASVTQIKASLEEYFMDLVEADRAQAAAIEVSGK
jgi:hypothetical protein